MKYLNKGNMSWTYLLRYFEVRTSIMLFTIAGYHGWDWILGLYSLRRHRPFGIGVPIINLRRPADRVFIHDLLGNLIKFRNIHSREIGSLNHHIVLAFTRRFRNITAETPLNYVSARGHSFWILDWTCYLWTTCVMFRFSTKIFSRGAPGLQLIVLAVFGAVY